MRRSRATYERTLMTRPDGPTGDIERQALACPIVDDLQARCQWLAVRTRTYEPRRGSRWRPVSPRTTTTSSTANGLRRRRPIANTTSGHLIEQVPQRDFFIAPRAGLSSIRLNRRSR